MPDERQPSLTEIRAALARVGIDTFTERPERLRALYERITDDLARERQGDDPLPEQPQQ